MSWIFSTKESADALYEILGGALAIQMRMRLQNLHGENVPP
jgi:hypothetical protein